MLHLVNKVYLQIDALLNTDVDRVVISKQYGHPMLPELAERCGGELLDNALSYDELVGEGKKYNTFIDFITTVINRGDETGDTVVICCDRTSFVKVLCAWYKTIFRQPTAQACLTLFKSYAFRQKVFAASRFAGQVPSGRIDFDKDVFQSAFETMQAPSETTRQAFLERIRDSLSVEYLLAGYLADGRHREALKRRLKPLISKDIEKYLYELKELFLLHLNRKEFQSKLQLSKSYSFDNFYEIINDPSPFAQLFFTERIWTTAGVRRPSSNGSINLTAITQEDIALLTEFTRLISSIWSEAGQYEFVNGDLKKLSFIKHFTNDSISEEGLQEVMTFELQDSHSSGSFYSLDIGTVNNYFIDYLLDCQRENNITNIEPYIVA